MWELAKKSDQKRTFVLVDVLMLAKPPLKKRHTCWTSQCVRSIGTIFPFLYLIGWSNSMDHKSRSRTKTDLKHNYPWISPPSHEQLKPLSKEKVNGYRGCLETPRLAPARCKRGSKMPGKSMDHMSWIKQNGREWNGTPDEFFFFRVKIAGDLLDFFFGERDWQQEWDLQRCKNSWMVGKSDRGRDYF